MHDIDVKRDKRTIPPPLNNLKPPPAPRRLNSSRALKRSGSSVNSNFLRRQNTSISLRVPPGRRHSSFKSYSSPIPQTHSSGTKKDEGGGSLLRIGPPPPDCKEPVHKQHSSSALPISRNPTKSNPNAPSPSPSQPPQRSRWSFLKRELITKKAAQPTWEGSETSFNNWKMLQQHCANFIQVSQAKKLINRMEPVVSAEEVADDKDIKNILQPDEEKREEDIDEETDDDDLTGFLHSLTRGVKDKDLLCSVLFDKGR